MRCVMPPNSRLLRDGLQPAVEKLLLRCNFFRDGGRIDSQQAGSSRRHPQPGFDCSHACRSFNLYSHSRKPT